MDIAVIQSENDFEIFKKYISKRTIYFAWHPQAVDACIERNLKYLTLEDISFNHKAKSKYTFVKEITKLFTSLDNSIKKQYKEEDLNFFINLSSYSRRIYFTYFNEIEKLEYLQKYFSKKKIYFCCYKINLLDPLSIILKNVKIKNIKIINVKTSILNRFMLKKDTFKILNKNREKITNHILINFFYNFFKCIFKSHFSVIDYLRFIFSSSSSKFFFLSCYLDYSEISLLNNFKKKKIYPLDIDWITAKSYIKKNDIKKINKKKDLNKIKLKFFKENLRSSLKKSLYLITNHVYMNNINIHINNFYSYKKIFSNKKIVFGLTKYVNEPLQALCFDLIKKKKLFGMHHGGGTYIYDDNPICDINFSTKKITINRFIGNHFVKRWVSSQNKNINNIKFRSKVFGSKYLNSFIKSQDRFVQNKFDFLYFAANLGHGNGCDNKWANHDDASYYKFLILLTNFFNRKKIKLKIKFRSLDILRNLNLFKTINDSKYITLTKRNIREGLNQNTVFLSSHFSTHMLELIMSNAAIIFLFKRNSQNINKEFFKKLRNLFSILPNEKLFFNYINSHYRKYNQNINYSQEFKKNFISDSKINTNLKIFEYIMKQIKK